MAIRDKTILETLRERILICDGAMGTMLQANGLKSGECPELWNADRPDVVEAIHGAYARAGADIVTTNTFGGTGLKLDAFGLGHRMAELNALGVRAAKTTGAYVAGSMGPTGRLLEPYGDLEYDDAVRAFGEQALVLAQAGADFLLLETFADLNELQAAIDGAKPTGIPIMATMTFDTGGRTMMGVTPKSFMEASRETGLSAAGVNCGGGTEQLRGAVRELLECCGPMPVIVQPNAGLPQLLNGETVYLESPEDLARFAKGLAGTSVRIFGSCCGSTPAHTKAICRAVNGDLSDI